MFWESQLNKGWVYDWGKIIPKSKSYSRQRTGQMALYIACQEKETAAFKPKFYELHPSLSISRLKGHSTFISPSANEPGN
jgi:hypothetical protein